MKANVPEKIYLVNDDLNIKREWYKTKQVGFDTTEYIRTDAFIEKAVEWLDNRGCLYIQYSEGGTSFNNKQFIEDFKKAMNL